MGKNEFEYLHVTVKNIVRIFGLSRIRMKRKTWAMWAQCWARSKNFRKSKERGSLFFTWSCGSSWSWNQFRPLFCFHKRSIYFLPKKRSQKNLIELETYFAIHKKCFLAMPLWLHFRFLPAGDRSKHSQNFQLVVLIRSRSLLR